MNPNLHQCQKCPPGLTCKDGVVRGIVTPNSTWLAESGVYHVLDCPLAHRIRAEAVELQECVGCPRGQECPQTNCSLCKDCRPGSYKESDAAELCVLCPLNSYNPIFGAAALGDCTKCPEGAITSDVGKASTLDCFCGASWYTISPPNASLVRCKECPIGAICSDGSCALARDDHTCPSTGEIPGTWVRNVDRTYSVVACPGGTRLINSSEFDSRVCLF